MNKRIKKKRELESKLQTLDSHNTEATNKRFDQVEADVKTLKKAKKPWFGRK